MTSKKNRSSVHDSSYRQNTLGSPKDLNTSDRSFYLRNEFERDYQMKYQQLKQLYEMRIQGLNESIKEAYRLVQSDDLIDTMRQDQTSEEFVNQRVKEILEECINNEREALVDKLTQENAELRAEYNKIGYENSKVTLYIIPPTSNLTILSLLISKNRFLEKLIFLRINTELYRKKQIH